MDASVQSRTTPNAEVPSFEGHSTLMVVRIWLKHRQVLPPVPSSGDDRARLRNLVLDLVTSRRGSLLTQHEEFMAFRIEPVTTALSVARQLQWALQGYRKYPSAPAAGAALVLDAETTGASEFDSGVYRRRDIESLLELAKPAQILITHSVYEELQELPGIEFRSFPERAGVYEYLWTSIDQLDALQTATDFSAAVVQAIPLPETGTVVASIEQKAIADRPSQASLLVLQIRTLLAKVAASSRITLHSTTAQLQKLLQFRRARVTVGASVLALLLIVTLVFYSLHRHRSNAQSLAKPAISTASQSSVPPSQPAITPAPQGTAPGSTESARDARSGSATTKGDKPATDRHSNRSGEAQGCSIGGQESTYLRLAERNRSTGKYQDAERQFREVLNCEPGNEQARDGLSKVLRAEQEHFGPAEHQ